MTHPRPNPAIYELGSEFYDEVQPAVFPKAILRFRNQAAAKTLGLQNLSEQDWKNHFHSFKALPGNIQKPLALRYHGHQFQHYNPDLGDGRGFLFAQFQTQDRLHDLGTKGSGTTPYSRDGDGKLTLKGAFREILATELLESYGVPTSQTFSVFETGESLQRYDEPSPTRSAVLVRLNHGHIRFGTFQRLAFRNETENIKKLIQYCCRHYYPELQNMVGLELVSNFLKQVSQKSAHLASHWMMAGFVHGVLNTDNMNITGESFDYGPYRFLPKYDPRFTAAYFDKRGLYAYGRQGLVVYWNLYQLGLALQVAEPELKIEDSLDSYSDDFNFGLQQQLQIRLNIQPQNNSPDTVGAALTDLFNFMDQGSIPFEQCLFDLHSGINDDRLNSSPLSSVYQSEKFQLIKNRLKHFTTKSAAIKENNYFKRTSPCTLLIDEIETIWKEIETKDDWGLFENKLQDIRSFRGIYSGR